MTNGTSCFGFSPFVGWGLCPSPLTLVGGASASTTAYGEREAAVLLKCGLCTPMWFSQDACTLSSTESGVMGTPGGTLAKLIANSTEPPQPPAQAAPPRLYQATPSPISAPAPPKVCSRDGKVTSSTAKAPKVLAFLTQERNPGLLHCE